MGDGAIVQIGERTRWVSALIFPETEVGDYVVVSALTIVDRLRPGQDDDAVNGGMGAIRELTGATR